VFPNGINQLVLKTSSLLEYNIVSVGKQSPTFQTSLLPSRLQKQLTNQNGTVFKEAWIFSHITVRISNLAVHLCNWYVFHEEAIRFL